MSNIIFVIVFVVLFFGILVCSLTSYMLRSLYVWRFSPVATHSCPDVSEDARQVGFLTQSGKRPGAGPGGGCLIVSRVSVFPRRTMLYQKHGKDTQKRRARSSDTSMNEASSIIFQFSATLKCFDVNILVLPHIQHTRTHT